MLIKCRMVLPQPSRSLGETHVTAIGPFDSDEELHECGLTASIGTGETVVVASGERYVDVLKQHTAAKTFRNVGDGDHRDLLIMGGEVAVSAVGRRLPVQSWMVTRSAHASVVRNHRNGTKFPDQWRLDCQVKVEPKRLA